MLKKQPEPVLDGVGPECQHHGSGIRSRVSNPAGNFIQHPIRRIIQTGDVRVDRHSGRFNHSAILTFREGLHANLKPIEFWKCHCSRASLCFRRMVDDELASAETTYLGRMIRGSVRCEVSSAD